MDPVATYLEMFEKLRKKKRWTTDSNILRFAAMALGNLDIPDPHAQLEATARTLRKGAGWFGPLNSPIRYVVAAMILRRGLQARTVHEHVRRARKEIGNRRMPRGGLSRTLAALLLVLHENGGPARPELLDRMKHILDRWKADHPWLTGVDDLPTAALHATRDRAPEVIASETERAYQLLREAGFYRGNALQLASHLLAFDGRGVDEAVRRFQTLSSDLKRLGVRVSQSRYDETAILALTQVRPSAIAERAVGFRDQLRAARPRPTADVAFSMAAGLALAEDVRAAEGKGAVSDMAQLRAVQSLLDAQQAAMVAVIIASTAATSAATSSS